MRRDASTSRVEPVSAEKRRLSSEGDGQPGKRRRILFRILLVAFPLVVLASVELLLRVLGIGYPTSLFVPWREGGTNLWVSNGQFTRRFFPLAQAPQPRPFAFPERKAANTIRIFILGESAALGEPDPKFGFGSMLAALLRERFRGQRFEIVNLGIVAINSHTIREIAQQTARREGDLWVVYMGNNEMVGPFGAVTVMGAQAPPLAVARASLAVTKLRLGQLLDSAIQSLRPGRVSSAEWHGMATFFQGRVRHDDPKTARVHRNFDQNLQDILDTAQESRIPVLLCTVGTNLKDCPPFGSLHKSGIPEAALARWNTEYETGKAAETRGEYPAALEAYRSAAGLDPTYAALQYRMGRCHSALRHYDEARPCFELARDYDALQFRADGAINDSIRRAAAEFAGSGVHLVDLSDLMAQQSPGGVTGREMFLEHVHLSPEGNYFVGRTLAGEIERLLFGESADERHGSRPDWLPQSECFAALGFTDLNRHDLLATIERLLSGPPFDSVEYPETANLLKQEIEHLRPATKLSRVRTFVPQLRQAVEKQPENPDLRMNLADALELCSDFAPAEAQWQAVTALLPQSAVAFFKLAGLQERQGRMQEAIASYRACLRRQPNYPSARERLERLVAK